VHAYPTVSSPSPHHHITHQPLATCSKRPLKKKPPQTHPNPKQGAGWSMASATQFL
jgi:hypothetical protein